MVVAEMISLVAVIFIIALNAAFTYLCYLGGKRLLGWWRERDSSTSDWRADITEYELQRRLEQLDASRRGELYGEVVDVRTTETGRAILDLSTDWGGFEVGVDPLMKDRTLGGTDQYERLCEYANIPFANFYDLNGREIPLEYDAEVDLAWIDHDQIERELAEGKHAAVGSRVGEATSTSTSRSVETYPPNTASDP